MVRNPSLRLPWAASSFQKRDLDGVHEVGRSVADLVATLPPDSAVVMCGDLRSAVPNPEVAYSEEVIDGVDMRALFVLDGGVASCGLW
jgi:hypothetical protein